jgi:hypothetical protein
LPVESCVIDGEAIVVDRQGLSVFDLLRYRHYDHAAVLCAFDLIEHAPASTRSGTCAVGPKNTTHRLSSTSALKSTMPACGAASTAGASPVIDNALLNFRQRTIMTRYRNEPLSDVGIRC